MRASVWASSVLPEPVGPIEQDVGLRELDILVLGRVVQALVVVVDRHREHALGAVLADDVVVEHLADFGRGRHAVGGLDHRGLVLFADDVHAQLDAFIADEHGRTGDQLANLMLGFPAERAIERVLGGFAVRCLFGHPVTPGSRALPKLSAITDANADGLNKVVSRTDLNGRFGPTQLREGHTPRAHPDIG